MIIRNSCIFIHTHNPFKNRYFSIFFALYSFFVILFSFSFVFFSGESQRNIRLLFLIPIIIQFLLSFFYFLKYKNKFIFIISFINFLQIIIYLFLNLYNLKNFNFFYGDDLILELLFSQIFNETITFILFLVFYHKKNDFFMKQISLFVFPIIGYFIFLILIINTLSYIKLWQIKKLYPIIEVILLLPICAMSIFIIPLAIINIFNPVLIYILSSIAKEKLLIEDKNNLKEKDRE